MVLPIVLEDVDQRIDALPKGAEVFGKRLGAQGSERQKGGSAEALRFQIAQAFECRALIRDYNIVEMFSKCNTHRESIARVAGAAEVAETAMNATGECALELLNGLSLTLLTFVRFALGFCLSKLHMDRGKLRGELDLLLASSFVGSLELLQFRLGLQLASPNLAAFKFQALKTTRTFEHFGLSFLDCRGLGRRFSCKDALGSFIRRHEPSQ